VERFGNSGQPRLQAKNVAEFREIVPAGIGIADEQLPVGVEK